MTGSIHRLRKQGAVGFSARGKLAGKDHSVWFQKRRSAQRERRAFKLEVAMWALFGFKEMGLAQHLDIRINHSNKEEPRHYQISIAS